VEESATFAGVAGKGLLGWEFSSLQEAENFASYLHCPLPNFLLSLQKDGVEVKDDSLGCIPMPDMSLPWTDERLQQQFGFTEAELRHIHYRVSGVQNHVTDAASSADVDTGSLRSFTTQQGSAFKVGEWVNTPKRVQQTRRAQTANADTEGRADGAKRQRRVGSIPGEHSNLHNARHMVILVKVCSCSGCRQQVHTMKCR
jgi:hypothetical protein